MGDNKRRKGRTGKEEGENWKEKEKKQLGNEGNVEWRKGRKEKLEEK